MWCSVSVLSPMRFPFRLCNLIIALLPLQLQQTIDFHHQFHYFQMVVIPCTSRPGGLHTKDIQYATRQCNKTESLWKDAVVACNTGICRPDILQEIVGKLCLKWRTCTTQRHHSLQGLHCFTGSPPTDPDHMWNTGCFEVPLFFNSRSPSLCDSLQSWSCQHVFTIIDLDDKLKVD